MKEGSHEKVAALLFFMRVFHAENGLTANARELTRSARRYTDSR